MNIVTSLYAYSMINMRVTLNTSNVGKREEFERLFGKHNVDVDFTSVDLKEIESDDISVVVHKACNVEERVLVEDTSLVIEGADVGINVRWLLENLSKYEGRKAAHVVLIARRIGEKVEVYKGIVEGKIGSPNGKKGFGFDPVFYPNSSGGSLAEYKGDSVNARAYAVKNYVMENVYRTRNPIYEWNGKWQ